MTGFNSIFRDDLFDGQIVLITGGGTGIGRCIAHELAALGAKVVLAGRRPEPLQATAKEIIDGGGQADTLPLNIRDEDAVEQAFASFTETFGGLHAVVNNAGGQFASPASAISPKGWRAVIDTNLNGTFLVARAAFNHVFSDQQRGNIVNIVADMWNGFPGMAHTGAARAGVVNLTKTLAVEWGPAGIRVNGVAPGFILSSGLTTYPEVVQQMSAQIMPKNPTGRLGTESEVSSAVAFLLSPAAAFINGETLKVDGAASLAKESMIGNPQPHDNLPAWDGFHLAAELPDAFK